MVKKVASAIAALLIIYGFSLLHRGEFANERMGSVLIGVGSLYFLVLLYMNRKSSSRSDDDSEPQNSQR